MPLTKTEDASQARASKRMFRPKWVVSLVTALSMIVLASPGIAGDSDSQSFSLHSKPVVTRGSQGPWTSKFVDPAAVVFHGGKYHMFFDGLPKWPHPLAIGYASSEDGYTWSKESDVPVLTAEDTGLDFESIMGSSAMVMDDGTWVLYFTLVHPTKNFVGSIGRATAKSPMGPWTVHPEPVLEPGPDGAWDGKFIASANVVKTDDGYRMYYTGIGKYQNGAFSEEHENVGMATSPDGITWTKHDDTSTTDALYAASDPVFTISKDENAWDSWSINDTNVQKTAGGWAMVYRASSFTSTGSLGLATSEDGITWQRTSDKPFLTKRDLGVGKLYFTAYLHHDGKDLVYVEGGSSGGTHIYMASRSYLY